MRRYSVCSTLEAMKPVVAHKHFVSSLARETYRGMRPCLLAKKVEGNGEQVYHRLVKMPDRLFHQLRRDRVDEDLVVLGTVVYRCSSRMLPSLNESSA